MGTDASANYVWQTRSVLLPQVDHALTVNIVFYTRHDNWASSVRGRVRVYLHVLIVEIVAHFGGYS